MSTALDTLDRMTEALTACTQGQLAQSDMIRQWRSSAASRLSVGCSVRGRREVAM